MAARNIQAGCQQRRLRCLKRPPLKGTSRHLVVAHLNHIFLRLWLTILEWDHPVPPTGKTGPALEMLTL